MACKNAENQPRIASKDELDPRKRACENAEKQLEPASQDELVPWKLITVDMRTPLEKDSLNEPVPPSQEPQETSATVPRSIPVSIPVDMPDTFYDYLKASLSNINQDMNKTPLKEEASDKSAAQPPIPEPTSSKIGKEDEITDLINLVRDHPHLYNTDSLSYRDKEKKDKSWTAISEVLGISDHDCRSKWESLRKKYNREMKQLSLVGCASEKTMQFIKKMNFIPYQQRTSNRRENKSESHESPESPSKKRKKSTSTSRSDGASSASHSSSSSSSDTKTPTKEKAKPRKKISRPDQAFAEGIASELQRFSSRRRILLKAKIWQVFAEYGDLL